jgi:hypothetical protein
MAQQESCGLCQKEITTNSDLARCFLDNYQNLAGQAGSEVVVDLNNCGHRAASWRPCRRPMRAPRRPIWSS